MASISSCKKPIIFSKENLTFSQDTIVFDTLFTTIGSTTKKLKIYNPSSRTLKVDQILLIGGSNSPFRINVDGVPGTHFSEIEMEGKDSLFIFVEVTLDPNNVNTPLIIEDQIKFSSNGKDQFVTLAAWGQDAYFYYSDISAGDFEFVSGTWPSDKPHVIYGGAFIDEGTTLNINAGAKIYLHKQARLHNYKGTLNINGTLGNEVTFQGDRLESYYADVTGQYYGIYFQEAKPSTINYAIIKNATTGIHIVGENESNLPGEYTVTVTNTIISNASSYGILLYNGEANMEAGSIKAVNCEVSQNGVHAFAVIAGGDFNFDHCHLLGYGSGENVGSAVGISNYFGGTGVLRGINEGTITSTVMYGNLDHELAIDTISDPAIDINLDFQHNLIRSTTIFTGSIFDNKGNLWNQDPSFKNVFEGDYTYWWNSALINNGSSTVFPTLDLLGKPRYAPTEIGAYEW